MEIWKDIPGYEGLYQVSNIGRVKSFYYYGGERERIMKPLDVGQGYLRVALYKNKKEKSHYIHALVLWAFVKERPKGLECNHLNGDKHDNRLENLEYCTRAENNLHFYRVLGKGYNKPSGEKCGSSKLTNEIVQKIRELYATGNYTQVTLAKMFGTSQTNVSGIIHRLIWRDI